jgi:hypothetical protein
MNSFSGLHALKIREEYLYGDFGYPPIFSIFYSCFELGMLLIPELNYDSERTTSMSYTQEILIKTPDCVIDEFLSMEKSIRLLEHSYEKDDEIWGRYLPIAEMHANKTVMLGVHQSNQDCIFVEDIHLLDQKERFVQVASNIFEFVSLIKFVADTKVGFGIESYDQLYKEWGDHAWRVKK